MAALIASGPLTPLKIRTISAACVILSSPIIIGEGTFSSEILSRRKALLWINRGPVKNYCGHESIRIFGLKPTESRQQCTYYDEALAISPQKRLEFGREYTQEEIEKIGAQFVLIRRQ
jgi:hypothetical protein